MKNIFAKKGVSPIVASVLLVVITIAIGATTMAFLRSLTDSNLEKSKEQTAKISCGTEVALQIPIIQNRNKVCYYADGTFNIMIHNIGTKPITGFNLVTMLSNGTIVTKEDATSLAKDGWVTLNITPTGVTNASSNVLQYRLEPKIEGVNGKAVCADSGVVKDIGDLMACS